MKVHYKGVLCNLATYRVMGEDKPALYYIDSPDQETMLKAGFRWRNNCRRCDYRWWRNCR